MEVERKQKERHVFKTDSMGLLRETFTTLVRKDVKEQLKIFKQ